MDNVGYGRIDIVLYSSVVERYSATLQSNVV